MARALVVAKPVDDRLAAVSLGAGAADVSLGLVNPLKEEFLVILVLMCAKRVAKWSNGVCEIIYLLIKISHPLTENSYIRLSQSFPTSVSSKWATMFSTVIKPCYMQSTSCNF